MKNIFLFVKRLFDIFVSIAVFVIIFPLLIWLALMIRTKIGSPILFIQERAGFHGKRFKMYKFRSMTNARDGNGKLLPDAERLTLFGDWLRSTSLDELPELWNVFCGSMSLVGPRPLLVEYLDRYTPEQARRHDVKSGMTGWAQINGRNAISWESKFKLDVWYVENWSLWLDLKILLRTAFKVAKREGISATGEVTMPKFEGSDS